MIVVVKDLAMQAVNALVRVDLAGRMDRLDGAVHRAGLAGPAAFPAADQPLEHARPGRQRQRPAERTEIAAPESAFEKFQRKNDKQSTREKESEFCWRGERSDSLIENGKGLKSPAHCHPKCRQLPGRLPRTP